MGEEPAVRVNGEGVASAPETCGRAQFRKGIHRDKRRGDYAASDGVSGGDVEHVGLCPGG